MSLLEQYEQQYAALIAEITAHIGRLQLQGGLERRELTAKIDTSLGEAHELLEQMGLEVRDLNATQRSSFTSKLNCAQVELKRLQNDFQKAKDTRSSNITGGTAGHQVTLDLGGGDAEAFYEDVAIGNDQRQRLLDNSERIERTGSRLIDGYRVALETEALGTQVLNDLNHQRETLQSARGRIRETNAELGRASRTLNSMMVRALREKAVLYGVGVCFVLAVGISLYLTFSSSTPEA